MIFDHRTYTVKPGTLPKQLELYEKHGKAPQERHLGKPLLYGVTETGPINTYVHVWVYENAGDREKRRAAMQADPDGRLPQDERRSRLPDQAGEQDPRAGALLRRSSADACARPGGEDVVVDGGSRADSSPLRRQGPAPRR